jgi:unsaturated rhamnogalacturonyl hydrolase
MAPPVWVKMYKATGERKYLDYVHDLNWKRTSDLLYDKEEHLYARDASYINKREPNGKKIFWSRGEGWVLGGIARILDYIPAGRSAARLLRAAAARNVGQGRQLQGPDGMWHAGLLDPADLSAAGGFGFGAVRVRRWPTASTAAILDEKTYRPVIAKAWAGILKNVYADGRLGEYPADRRRAGVLSADIELQLRRRRLHAGGVGSEEDGGAGCEMTARAFRMKLKPGTVAEYRRAA